MPRSYYYLVASLPDIILDTTKKGFSLSTFINDVSEQINPKDSYLLSTLRFPFDNKNLINLIRKYKAKFEESGNFSRDELEQEIKLPDILPQYMKIFLESYKEEKLLFPELSLEDQLNWLFYEEVTNHSNTFIREWFSFDLNLRNVLAGINCRAISKTDEDEKNKFSLFNSIICKNDVSELIQKSNAPDFSLANQLPWIENVISLSKENLVEYEKKIDSLRWDMLNEFTTFTYFQIETILAFCIKLKMVERWQKLEPETGKERLSKLLSELKKGYNSPKDLS